MSAETIEETTMSSSMILCAILPRQANAEQNGTVCCAYLGDSFRSAAILRDRILNVLELYKILLGVLLMRLGEAQRRGRLQDRSMDAMYSPVPKFL